MSRLMIMTLPVRGHVNALIGVAEQLLARGHSVEWVTYDLDRHGSTKRLLSRVPGLAVRELVHSGRQMEPTRAGASLLAHADERLRRMFDGMLHGPRQLQEPAREAIRAARPDAIAIDPMSYGFIIAASLERVPFGCLTTFNILAPDSLTCERADWDRALDPARREWFEEHRLSPPRFKNLLYLSSALNTCWTTRELVGELAEVPPATHLVGPSRSELVAGEGADDFPWDRLRPDRPLVYLSFGTIYYWRPELLATFARAAQELGAQLVLSAQQMDGNFLRELPGDVIALPWIPQRKVLARADAFVTHASTNGITEALDHGVPLFAVPLASDQPVGAFFVERAGVGLARRPEEIDDQVALEGLRRLLEDGRFKAAASRVQQSFRAHDGAARAAELLAGLVA
jgi:zeaxanthin glucosyltransferase